MLKPHTYVAMRLVQEMAPNGPANGGLDPWSTRGVGAGLAISAVKGMHTARPPSTVSWCCYKTEQACTILLPGHTRRRLLVAQNSHRVLQPQPTLHHCATW